MAGGLEIRTYGIALSTGKCLYVCSPLHCKNMTDDLDTDNYVAVIERSTRTVRAIEPRTGTERWNFSVGTHDIKIPLMDCINTRVNYDFNISAVLPEGKLNVGVKGDFGYRSWDHKFTSPIVHVWQYNGRDLNLVDVFKSQTESSAALYVGMHNKQVPQPQICDETSCKIIDFCSCTFTNQRRFKRLCKHPTLRIPM